MSQYRYEIERLLVTKTYQNISKTWESVLRKYYCSKDQKLNSEHFRGLFDIDTEGYQLLIFVQSRR